MDLARSRGSILSRSRADVDRSRADAARSRGADVSSQPNVAKSAHVDTMATTLAAVKQQQYGMKSLARKDDFGIKKSVRT